MIQSAISHKISKNILLSNNLTIDKLDDAIIETENEDLFSNILNINTKIKATSSLSNKVGKWIKLSDNEYSFIIAKDLKVIYSLEDDAFICKSSLEICSKVQ